MSFKLRFCEDKREWDDFVASSPQGSVFSSSDFLDALKEEYRLLLLEDGQRTLLGTVVLGCNSNRGSAPHPFTMYQGILLSRHISELPCHRRVPSELQVLEYLLDEMKKMYERMVFCLHYSFKDIRAFQWLHYHEPELGRCKIDIGYTGLLDISGFANYEEYLTTIRKVRLQEYRKAKQSGLIVQVSHDIDMLDRLHRLTFERQGITRDENEAQLLRTLSEAAISHNFGEILICRDREETVCSATLFLNDKNSGYYMYGANDPAFRASGSSTLLLLENIRRCLKKGLKRVDFVGVNSPNRGDYKTSFNATPTPYFFVTWN